MKVHKEIVAFTGLCLLPLGLVLCGVTTEAPREAQRARLRLSPSEQPLAQSADQLSEPVATSAAVPSTPQVVSARPKEAVGGEEDLLRQLRELQLKDPVASLTVAQLADDLYPRGPTTPERSWFEARALVELGRFDEARMVALRMVEDFPDAHFTKDLSRHLLSHPFGLTPREH